MSKAYVLTAVNHIVYRGVTCDGKARLLGVFLDRNDAQKMLNDDMDNYKAKNPTYYKEGELAMTDEYGNGCDWNIEEVNIRLPLTPLQIANLNSLALTIAGNPKAYAYSENLSDEERDYLLLTLKNTYKIDIEKEGN